MKNFQILGHTITFSTERINYYQMTMTYQHIATEASRQLKQEYSRLGNMKNVINNLEETAMDIYNGVIETSVDYIQQQKIYTIDNEGLLAICIDVFDNRFLDPFSSICDKYAEIIGAQKEAAEHRRMRKAGRTKFYGGGFGISGAVSGSLKAGTMNMATGIGHSLFNAVGNAGSGAVSAARQSSLYNDKETIDSLAEGIYTACYLVCFEVMNIISSQSATKFESISKDETTQARALSNNILRHTIPRSDECSSIVQSLTLNPENKELMEYAIHNYGDSDNSIEQMGTFFGYDLKSAKSEMIEETFGDIEKKQYQTEAELLKEKEDILQKCAEYGMDAGPFISILDAKWLEIDKALRTVEGIEYPSRDTARNVEKDIETFLKKCREFHWDDANLLDENSRTSYEEKIKNADYLEKAFTVQIRERLEKIWEPYIYRQDIISRLSNPETFLENFHETMTKEPFYKELKKKIHFHDFAENTQNKAPALDKECGAALLFIDQTLFGGKKGTIFTTRKLIEYDKRKNRRTDLTEIAEIKPENGDFSVLDAQGNIILTLSSPFFLDDKNKGRYAASLTAIAAGISRTDISAIEKILSETGPSEQPECPFSNDEDNINQTDQSQHDIHQTS